MTPGVFQGQLDRLRVLRFPPSDFNPHWEALHDIPDELFTAAVSLALRTRVEFPVPAELRADTDAVVRRQAAPQAVHPTSRLVPTDGDKTAVIANPFGGPSITVKIQHELRPVCDDCDDRGWVLYWCGEEPSKHSPWLYRRKCDRRHVHGDHDYADRCPCVETNPEIQRRKAAQGVKYAQDQEKASR